MITPTLLDNRYKVLRVLGSGGFGETFLAEDTQMPSGRRCVIKQLKPVGDNPQVYQLVQERFQREAAILEELGDRIDQIPRLYAYFSQNSQFYLVQEYVEGQTLTQKVQQQGVFSESAVREILINILPVLDFVHSHRMVHRDIKPDNIILRFSDGKPALIDFGAVKETMGTVMTPSGNSTRSIVIGTPGFMPMEQSVGRPVFSSDIYSLGLSAIYLLTGKIPPELGTDPGTGELMWRNFAVNVSPTLAAVLDKAVQQSPRDRYYSAKEMLAALQPPAPVSTPVTTPPSAGYVSPPSTVPSTPIANNGQSVAISAGGLGTWQQAVIIGSVIGVIVIAGLWMMRIFGQNPQPEFKTINPSPSGKVTSTPKAVGTPTSTPQSSPTFQPLSTARISQRAALRVVQQWMRSKGDIFGPAYRTDLGTEFLTGIAYVNNIRKTDDPDACLASGIQEDDCLSSVDWLRRNNAYYSYGVQKLDYVENFAASGNKATLEVVITEERTLYKNGKVAKDNTSFDTLLVRYSLEYVDGKTKISDYKSVVTIRK